MWDLSEELDSSLSKMLGSGTSSEPGDGRCGLWWRMLVIPAVD